ncbi:MAG TPA: hypothetical protein VNI36_05925 [Candidatus Dormibacteraeota bacterium]|nr:hypothetical protein [Candidatus Dormibacteraeota bacterium]
MSTQAIIVDPSEIGKVPVAKAGAPLPQSDSGDDSGAILAANYARNKAYSKPGPYTTKLAPADEQKFQQWVKQNKVPWQDTPTADYDMRGYWKAQQAGNKYAKTAINPQDHLPHYPDTWKTPYDATFSNESQYATPSAPHWEGNRLVSTEQEGGAPGTVTVDPDQLTANAPPQAPAQPKQPGTTLPAVEAADRPAGLKAAVAGPGTFLGTQEPNDSWSELFHHPIKFAESVPSGIRDLASKPIANLQALQPASTPQEHPFYSAVAKTASGFITPENVGIGELLGPVYKAAQAGEPVALLASRWASGVFAALMGAGATEQAMKFAGAYRNGDKNGMLTAAGEFAVTAPFAVAAGAHAASETPAQTAQPNMQAAQEPEAAPAPPRVSAGALPAAPEMKALPPGPRAPREAIGEGLQSDIGPGEKPIPLPERTPKTIPPGEKPIAAGPTTIDPRELTKGRSTRAAATVTAEQTAPPAELTPAQQALELKGQIRKLEGRASELRSSSLKNRTYEAGQKNIAAQRALAEKLAPLRAQLEKIEPRPEAKPLSRPVPEDEKIGGRIGGPKTYQQERPTKAQAAPSEPKQSKTPTYDRLPPEMREVVDSLTAAHSHLPQILREANEADMRKLSEPGTSGKEQYARLVAKEAGIGAKPEAQPFSKTAGEPPAPKPVAGTDERTPIGERRLVDEGAPAGSAERRLAERRAAVQAGASPLMRSAAVSEDQRLANDQTAPERDRRIARERIADIQAHPGETSEPADIAKVRAAQERTRGTGGGRPEAPAGMTWVGEGGEPSKNPKRAARLPKGPTNDQILAEAYKPGNVVKGYSGYDKVLSFRPGDPTKPYPGNRFSVRVIESDKEGNPLPGAREREHSTPPDRTEAIAAKQRLASPAKLPEILPGMTKAVAENRAAAAKFAGEQLTKEIARPLSNIDTAAGTMERESPLFRDTGASGQKGLFSAKEKPQTDRESLLGKGNTLHFGVDPTMVGDLYRKVNDAYQEHVADPAIEKLGLGRTHKDVEAVDPKLASRIRRYEAAPQYFRTKAEDIAKRVTDGLTREQERLFSLMADQQSRENLQKNHPAEYAQALADKGVQTALARYKPYGDALTKAHAILGGAVMPGDHLPWVYPEHVSGMGQRVAETDTGGGGFDRGVTPQRADQFGRTTTAEYHYKNGLHEFGPAFARKFSRTMTKLAEHATAMDFMSKATAIEPGDRLPPMITYSGKRFYSPEVLQMIREAKPGKASQELGQSLGVRTLPQPRNAEAYARYQPTGGKTTPTYLGPRAVVQALKGLDDSDPGRMDPVGRFLQEQIIGAGLGVRHGFNLFRRITQTFPLGTSSPVNWIRAVRVMTDHGLRERALARTNDPAYDALLRWSAISPEGVGSWKEYQGGNLNPANWLRTFAKVGNRWLFEPGGIDQKSRIWMRDLLKSQRPDISDERAAQLIRDQLGSYSRQNWTKNQKLLSHLLLFPGWDFSTINWVIRHPIRTALPPAILVMLVNQAIHRSGGKQEPGDQWDPFAIHAGGHAYGTPGLEEPLARAALKPFGRAVQARLEGQTGRQAVAEGARAVPQALAGFAGMTRPDLAMPFEVAAGKTRFGRDIVGQGDFTRRGTVLPNKGAEDIASHALEAFFPPVERMTGQNQTLPGALLSNFGLNRYQEPSRRPPASQRTQDVYNVKDDIRALERQAEAIAQDNTLSPDEKQRRLVPLRRKFQELIAKDRPQ